MQLSHLWGVVHKLTAYLRVLGAIESNSHRSADWRCRMATRRQYFVPAGSNRQTPSPIPIRIQILRLRHFDFHAFPTATLLDGWMVHLPMVYRDNKCNLFMSGLETRHTGDMSSLVTSWIRLRFSGGDGGSSHWRNVRVFLSAGDAFQCHNVMSSKCVNKCSLQTTVNSPTCSCSSRVYFTTNARCRYLWMYVTEYPKYLLWVAVN